MPRLLLHPGKHAGRVILAVVGAMLLTGCQSLSSAGSYAKVRVIDLSGDTQTVDVYHGSSAVAYNLSFGTVTSYVSVAPGNATLTVDTAGSRQVLSSVKGMFNAGAQYTVLVNSPTSNSQQILLADPPQSLSASATPSLRLIHQAVRAGAVDVYLVPAGQRLGTLAPIAANLAAGAATSYIAVPVGIAAIVMLPAGTVPTAAAAIHSGRQIRYSDGVARSLILVDAQPSSSSGVQVIMTTDTESAN